MPGNGFLMRQGYTILEAGWDATAPGGGGRFTMRVPVAKASGWFAIVGPSIEEFVVDDARQCAAADLSRRDARQVESHPDGPDAL